MPTQRTGGKPPFVDWLIQEAMDITRARVNVYSSFRAKIGLRASSPFLILVVRRLPCC